jgi:hypothetical protein
MGSVALTTRCYVRTVATARTVRAGQAEPILATRWWRKSCDFTSQMLDLRRLSVTAIGQLSDAISASTVNSTNMEECAQNITRRLYDEFLDNENRRPQCVLVRCFKTHVLGQLPHDLRALAGQAAPEQTLDDATKCLVLLGTSGIRPEWNARQSSASHQAIPLPSPKIVARFPMIAQVLTQLGVDVAKVLRPSTGVFVDTHEELYNVFYVEDAHDSPHIPAQQAFVVPYRVQTVLGLGGMLPSGDMFMIVMFTRVKLPRDKAELFKPLAISVKNALLPFDFGTIFRHYPAGLTRS